MIPRIKDLSRFNTTAAIARQGSTRDQSGWTAVKTALVLIPFIGPILDDDRTTGAFSGFESVDHRVWPHFALYNVLSCLSHCRVRVRSGRTFSANTSGATAVEFALVSSALIFSILFIMTVGLILYFNQALDYATSKAARQIMIGAVQKSNLSQASFRTQTVCPYLPAAFNCNNVIVNLQTATEAAQPGGYYAFVNSGVTALIIPPLSNSSTQYSPGAQQSYEYLQIIYPITFIPSVFAAILGQATFNGAPAFLSVSTVAFKNEQY